MTKAKQIFAKSVHRDLDGWRFFATTFAVYDLRKSKWIIINEDCAGKHEEKVLMELSTSSNLAWSLGLSIECNYFLAQAGFVLYWLCLPNSRFMQSATSMTDP